MSCILCSWVPLWRYLWHLWDPCQQWNRPKDHETDMKYCFFVMSSHLREIQCKKVTFLLNARF